MSPAHLAWLMWARWLVCRNLPPSVLLLSASVGSNLPTHSCCCPQLLLQQKKKHWFYQIIFTKTSEIQIFIPFPTISHPFSTGHTCIFTRGQCFPGGSVIKNPPAKQEMQARFLDREDPLEKEMATHSNILPGKSHKQRNLAGYNLWGNKELDTT